MTTNKNIRCIRVTETRVTRVTPFFLFGVFLCGAFSGTTKRTLLPRRYATHGSAGVSGECSFLRLGLLSSACRTVFSLAVSFAALGDRSGSVLILSHGRCGLDFFDGWLG